MDAAKDRGAHLLEAALDVLADGGLSALSVRTVATRADVSPAQVQYYFSSRAALVEAVFDRAGDQFVTEVGAVLQRTPPARRLKAALWCWLPLDARRERRVQIWIAYSSACASDEAMRPRAAALDAELRTWFADELAAAEAPDRTPRAVRRHRDAAAELLALVDGACLHLLNLPAGERQAFAERLVGGWLTRWRRNRSD